MWHNSDGKGHLTRSTKSMRRDKPRFEVAHILQKHHHQIPKLTANSWQARTLYAIAACRTSVLGGHVDKCSSKSCSHVHISYNSCRNRHCPKCQGNKRDLWIQAREEELLNVPYYHIVFTLPDQLNKVALYKPDLVYNLLFKTAWSVIRDFADNRSFLGAQTGMIAVLHTWGQNLSLHPHLHCIVPGGGITSARKWKNARGKGKYLFPVKVLSKVFRARYIAALRKEISVSQEMAKALFANPWVVYCKQPFAAPQHVIRYLGRYTHKVAISNHRIIDIAGDNVIFSAKDYRHGNRKITIRMNPQEFVRRFALHILPKGFVRMRHYGILCSSKKGDIIPELQKILGKPEVHLSPVEIAHRICPVCRKGTMMT
ncbi:MAG: IS91 family transposase, partial [Marinilabiliales bacterium]